MRERAFAVDHSGCFGQHRAVQGNHVAFRENFLPRSIAAPFVLQLRADVPCADEQFHAECARDPAEGLSDLPVADDAGRLSGKLDERHVPEAEIRILCPLAAVTGFAVCADMQGRSPAAALAVICATESVE
jgi:hypothetical protein